jgi:hypothetical protein
MKTLSTLVMFVALIFMSIPAQAGFLCGKKCKAKKTKAKAHLAQGGNCTDLRGSAKRKCKRIGRKKARKVAKKKCKGRGRACRRTIKRDLKAKQGLYGFVGAKKANAKGRENWDLFNQRSEELQAMLNSGEISYGQYQDMIKDARHQRKRESNSIGRSKTIKTLAVAGIAFGGIGVIGASATALGVNAIANGGRRRNLANKNNAYQEKLNQMKEKNNFQQPQFENTALPGINAASGQNFVRPHFQQSALPGMNEASMRCRRPAPRVRFPGPGYTQKCIKGRWRTVPR